MSKSRRKAPPPLPALIALVLALVGITITVTVRSGDEPPGSVSVTISKVPVVTQGKDGPVVDAAPATTVAEASRAPGDLSDPDGLRTAKPDGVPSAQLAAGERQADAIADGPAGIPRSAGLGAAEDAPGCQIKYVVNQSGREGTAPRAIVVHYPVMANRPGLGDMLGLLGWLNNPRAQVSYHRVFDWDRHCFAVVPLARKSWSVAGFNRVTINYSMMGRGAADGRFAPPAALRAMAADIARTAKQWGIPIRRARISGCTVVSPGITDHAALGACGGGHVDIKPWSVDDVIAEVRRAAGSTSAQSRARGDVCNKLRHHRRAFARERPGTKEWETRRARIVTLKARAARIGLDERKCRA